MSATKIITAITGMITAVGGLIIAINTMFDDEQAPQPITHIIIQEVGDYDDFLENTNLEQYDNLK